MRVNKSPEAEFPKPGTSRTSTNYTALREPQNLVQKPVGGATKPRQECTGLGFQYVNHWSPDSAALAGLRLPACF